MNTILVYEIIKFVISKNIFFIFGMSDIAEIYELENVSL